jgi:predicted MFS family arabinose efflux permease
VALVTGALGGLASAPGCLAGGYLCNRFSPRSVLMATGLACAFGEAAMAWAPHTPDAFTAFVLANKMLLGLSWGAVPAVILETLSARATATVAACMSSLTNLPVVLVTIVVGGVQTRGGTDAMLLAEAALGGAGVAAYALLAWAWKPGGAPAPAASPA